MELAQSQGVGAVATNDVRFLTRADFEAHEARVCIHDGALLAAQPAAALLRRAVPEIAGGNARAVRRRARASGNTLEVAKRCSLEIRLGASMLPAYPVPAGRTTEEFLREESARGLGARLAASRGSRCRAAATRAAYEARLELELGVICAWALPDTS